MRRNRCNWLIFIPCRFSINFNPRQIFILYAATNFDWSESFLYCYILLIYSNNSNKMQHVHHHHHHHLQNDFILFLTNPFHSFTFHKTISFLMSRIKKLFHPFLFLIIYHASICSHASRILQCVCLP